MQAVVKFPNGKDISFNGLFAVEDASRFVFAYWIDHNIKLEFAIEEGAVPGSHKAPGTAPSFLQRNVSIDRSGE